MQRRRCLSAWVTTTTCRKKNVVFTATRNITAAQRKSAAPILKQTPSHNKSTWLMSASFRHAPSLQNKSVCVCIPKRCLCTQDDISIYRLAPPAERLPYAVLFQHRNAWKAKLPLMGTTSSTRYEGSEGTSNAKKKSQVALKSCLRLHMIR